SRLSEMTRINDRQYGRRYASSRGVPLRNHIQARGSVGIERNSAHVFEVAGVVQIDRIAGVVDVQYFAIRAALDGHARAALKFHAPVEFTIGQIEAPEFVAPDLGMNAVAPFTARRQSEADADRRSQSVKIDAFLRQVHARDAHDPPVRHGILDLENAGQETGLFGAVVERAKVHASQARLKGTRQLPFVHFFEILRVQDGD